MYLECSVYQTVSNFVLGQKQKALRTICDMHVLFNGSFVQEICMNVCTFPSGSICVFGSGLLVNGGLLIKRMR